MKKKNEINNLSIINNIKKKVIFFIIYFFLFSLLVLPLWLNKKFGYLYFEQFRFNLTLIYYGFLDGDSNLINSSIKWLIFIPIILSIITIYIQNLINYFHVNRDSSIDLIIDKLLISFFFFIA